MRLLKVVAIAGSLEQNGGQCRCKPYNSDHPQRMNANVIRKYECTTQPKTQAIQRADHVAVIAIDVAPDSVIALNKDGNWYVAR